MKGEADSKPRVFIGSSSEGRKIADAIQLNFEHDFEATIWNQGVFGLSETTLENLDRASREFDFAVIVLTPDDLTVTRGQSRNTPRDNVLLEVGLFIGRLGRSRTFIVLPGGKSVELPTDLAGVTVAEYASRSDGNLQAALGPVCTRIRNEICRLVGISASDTHVKGFGKPTVIPRRRRRRSLGTAHGVGPKASMRIVNISITGTLLETTGEIPIGQVLDLNLELDTGDLIHVVGKVVRIQRPDWGKVGGVGVAFTDYSENSKETLAKYVEADLALVGALG